MLICFKTSVSFLSRKGSLMPARPIRIFGDFLMPEMMNALSGGALTYPVMMIMMTMIIVIVTVIKNIQIIKIKIMQMMKMMCLIKN